MPWTVTRVAEFCEHYNLQLTLVFYAARRGNLPKWWAAIDQTPGLIEDEDDCLTTAWGETADKAAVSAMLRAQEILEAKEAV